MLQRYLLVWLLLGCLAAWFWPMTGQTVDPFLRIGGAGIHRLIVVVMLAVGMLLPVEEVNAILSGWPKILGGTAVQYSCMPAIAWCVVQLFSLPDEVAVGVLLAGCVPGAMASNVLTLAANGNVSYSVCLTTSATVLSPVVVPLVLSWTVGRRVDYDGVAAVRVLLLEIVAPVVGGHLLSRYSPHAAHAARRLAGPVANIGILVIVAVAVALQRERISEITLTLTAALLTLNVGGYFAGLGGSRLLKLSGGQQRALTLEVGMQNAGAGTVLALELFGENSAAVIPCALYTFGCMLTGTLLSGYWSRVPLPEDATPKSTEKGE